MALDYPNIDIAPFIDHSLLLPIATPEQIIQWCDEAYRYNFASVCVNPCYVKQAAELLYKKILKFVQLLAFPMVQIPQP
jgi:Deoxyribose-phosphate aldolase